MIIIISDDDDDTEDIVIDSMHDNITPDNINFICTPNTPKKVCRFIFQDRPNVNDNDNDNDDNDNYEDEELGALLHCGQRFYFTP